MKTKGKVIIWSILGIFIAVIGCVIWIGVKIPETVRDVYGQWVSAELVIGYYQEHRQLPRNWQDLQPMYGDGKGLHHGGLSFSQIKERMIIEFDRLGELQELAHSTSNVIIPKIIRTKSGIKSHWQGAEPSQLIYEYFRGLQQTNSVRREWFFARFELWTLNFGLWTLAYPHGIR